MAIGIGFRRNSLQLPPLYQGATSCSGGPAMVMAERQTVYGKWLIETDIIDLPMKDGDVPWQSSENYEMICTYIWVKEPIIHSPE